MRASQVVREGSDGITLLPRPLQTTTTLQSERVEGHAAGDCVVDLL